MRGALLAVLLLGVFTALAASSAWQASITTDEVAHFPALAQRARTAELVARSSAPRTAPDAEGE
jgi:hypothetical protein